MSQVSSDQLEALRAAFSGVVLTPTDTGYDDVRQVHNGMIDKRPALIARCLSTADIVDAVNLGRDSGMEISVRGGGHNVAGKAVTDGGLMIDLSLMKGIHVDPGARTVRAQGGTTWAEFNRAAALYGLATTGGVISSTGVSGLTLGGGLGWLMGRWGLSIDCLLSAEVVTAAGEALTASAEQNPDLFWAIRGGGGNFGVASSLEFQSHPLTMVTGGPVIHPLSAAAEMLAFFREQTSVDQPDDLTVFGALVHAPDGSGLKVAGMVACHAGDPAQAESDVAAVKAFGSPIMDMIGPLPYAVMGGILDEAFPKGARNYWKSTFLRELSDDAIAVMIDRFERCPSPMCGMVVEPFRGAVTRVPATATAFPHREAGYNLVIAGEWLDPADDDVNIAWARDTLAAMAPFTVDRQYVNYMAVDDADLTRQAYGPNWDRLVELKRRYDPDNLFRLNQNIPPT